MFLERETELGVLEDLVAHLDSTDGKVVLIRGEAGIGKSAVVGEFMAMASSIDFALVVGTPPTMIAYATRLYTGGEIFRKGIILDFVGIAILVFVVTRIWELLELM